jgi:hypothetical protein
MTTDKENGFSLSVEMSKATRTRMTLEQLYGFGCPKRCENMTDAPVIMIAEKAIDLIRPRARI